MSDTDGPKETPWYFHDSPLQLDDPKAPLPTATAQTTSTPDPDQSKTKFREGAEAPVPEEIDQKLKKAKDYAESGHNKDTAPDINANGPISSPIPRQSSPVFSTTSYVGGVSPIGNWAAFNPSDNSNLNNAEADEVTVGRTRLHAVSLKEQTIRPIYWMGSHQSANVHRATWFYSTTLSPIEPSLEDALKSAYEQVRPWTEEYLFELIASIGVPEALEKIKFPIEYYQNSGDASKSPSKHSVVAVFAPCCKQPEELSKDQYDKLQELTKTMDKVTTVEYPVVYLLPPASNSMLSFIYTGPTPIQLLIALLSGKAPQGTVFTVQRHFTWKAWKELNKLPDRPTDDIDFVPKKAKQLVLVFHGIGQKLSDRMESFNFTYAINGFRIAVEEQGAQPGIAPYIDDHVTVLPVNWRKTVNFEDLKRNRDGNITSGSEEFSLQDITIKSIPAVRNIITDVMLDIPYYMSHYKPMLLEAAVKEANRVYKLFCHHNPDFEQDGQVNLIGHSLGSVIAMDILSSQPTDCKAPAETDQPTFAFNTSNLFLAGSPAAFFLLLENSRLYPREYNEEMQRKLPSYGCMAVDNVYNVFHYSDPVANLLNPTVDPVFASTLETATLPTEKQFPVKNESTSTFFDSIASRLPRGFWDKKSTETLKPDDDSKGGGAKPEHPKLDEGTDTTANTDPDADANTTSTTNTHADTDTNTNPDTIETKTPLNTTDTNASSASINTTVSEEERQQETARLGSDVPSEVELETRDFRREYHAEDKMHLLNDNGQIDFMIPLTGTLENQYLSMLTAHSGYWENKDFARLVAVECGRQRGRDHILPQYAAKKKHSGHHSKLTSQKK